VRKAVLAALAFVMVMLFATVAHAEKILLVDDEDTHHIGVRLRAELVSLGFEVEVALAPAAEPSRASLEQAARDAGAVAALRVRSSRAGVEVWVMDRVTSKTVLREVVFTGGDDEGVVAVRAVELLRASLLEVELPSAPRGEVAPTPAVLALLPPPRPRPERTLSLVIAPAAALSPGGIGVTPQLDVWLRVRATAHFTLALRILAPTFPAAIDAPEGRSTVTLGATSLGGDVLFGRTAAALRGHAGVGVGLLWTHLEGTAAQPFAGRSDDLFSALSYLHGGATYALGESVRIFADGTVGVATPRPVVRFADRAVASWGQPAVALALGVELPLF
jgi:hypothetical protein